MIPADETLAFERVVAIVLAREGIHADDPADPGGDTWYGISRRSYPTLAWPPDRATAVAIYRRDYWLAEGCDQLPWPVSAVVFDGVVNSGAEGVRALQIVLGVAVDGVNGPLTRRAAAGYPDPIDLACRTAAARAAWYMRVPDGSRWLDGWLYRLMRNQWDLALAG